jgi:tetratricopeptide (TPR) repeat protein
MKSVWQRLMIAVAVAAMSAGGRAGAHECADVSEHLARAERALDVGDYATAIEQYRLSYELVGRPVILVLLARTYANAGRPLEALDLYRRYLAKVPRAQRTFAVENEIARLARLEHERVPVFPDRDPPAFRHLPVFDDTEPAAFRRLPVFDDPAPPPRPNR